MKRAATGIKRAALALSVGLLPFMFGCVGEVGVGYPGDYGYYGGAVVAPGPFLCDDFYAGGRHSWLQPPRFL